MEMEDAYCLEYGFEDCESDGNHSRSHRVISHTDESTISPPAIPCSNDQSLVIYRRTASIPKKPKLFDSPRKKALRRRIINLKKNVTRLRKKVTNMKDLIKLLSKKNLLCEENCDRMREIFLGDSAKIFENQVANSKKPPKGRRYCREIKHFALTLHFYSPKAYEFCR